MRINSVIVSGLLWLIMQAVTATSAHAQAVVDFQVEGDRIERALAARAGDITRGRSLAVARDTSCILCHSLPEPDQRFYGDLGPALAGIGARLTVAQLRLRLVDSRRLTPQTIMPAYHVVDGLNRVAAGFRDKPLLNAEQIEDLIAYLGSLK